MKLINLIPLREIDFRNQDQFDNYVKQHSLRPDTKVTIAGKVTTAGQAAQNSEPVKGASIFGKDSGGSVFGKSDSMATVNSIAAKTGMRAQAVAGWADENGVNLSKVSADIDSKKLNPKDLMTAVVGNTGNKYAKDIIAKYSQSASPKSDMGVDSVVYNKKTKTVGIVRMPDERGETKTDADGNVNTDELEPYNPMKYPHQKDAKAAPSTSKEIDARGLWKPFSTDSDSAKLTSMIPKNDKSITDIKVDKQVDVSTISKSILPNLRVADASGYPDKDAAELKQRLDKGDNGVYTRTSPHGGNIVFKDGTRFQVYRPHDAKKTKSTTIYASKR